MYKISVVHYKNKENLSYNHDTLQSYSHQAQYRKMNMLWRHIPFIVEARCVSTFMYNPPFVLCGTIDASCLAGWPRRNWLCLRLFFKTHFIIFLYIKDQIQMNQAIHYDKIKENFFPVYNIFHAFKLALWSTHDLAFSAFNNFFFLFFSKFWTAITKKSINFKLKSDS